MSASVVRQFSCTTTVEETKVVFRWLIEGFSRLDLTTGQFISSESFSLTNDQQNVCTLKLYPNGIEDYQGSVSVHLQCDNISDKFNAKTSLAIIGANNNDTLKLDSTGKISKSTTSSSWEYYITREYVMNARNGLLNDQTLTLECEILYNVTKIANRCDIGNVDRRRQKLNEDIQKLFGSTEHFDVIVEVDGKQFKAHKNILSARSPVFQKMFEHPFNESKDNKVVIPDIDKEVFEEVLRFIYTADIIGENTDYNKLLSAADKYALEELVAICVNVLAKDLTVDSVCDILLLADMHSSEALKYNCFQFIKRNAKAVMATEGWKRLSKNSELVSECFSAVVVN